MKRHKRLPKLGADDLKRFNRRLVTLGGCLVSLGSNIRGYGVFKVRGQQYFMHRLAYFIVSGRDPGQKYVCHKCDNPSCYRKSHLFLGTDLDNMRDKVAKGRARSRPPKGVKNHNAKLTNAKLTNAKVIAIRKSTMSHRALGAKYGVSHRVIGRIESRKYWHHV